MLNMNILKPVLIKGKKILLTLRKGELRWKRNKNMLYIKMFLLLGYNTNGFLL